MFAAIYLRPNLFEVALSVWLSRALVERFVRGLIDVDYLRSNVISH